MGLGEPVIDFRLPSDPAAEASIDEFFGAAGIKPRNRVVVLNPGRRAADKRWPPDRFAALAARLASRQGRTSSSCGDPARRAWRRRSPTDLPDNRTVLSPSTSSLQLIAVLRRASLMVAADTGPLHLAAALGTPCLGLYGPTDPARNGPYGHGHRTLQGADGQIASVEVSLVSSVVDVW